ncbi:YbaN family protein [Methylomonas sp. MgM2]
MSYPYVVMSGIWTIRIDFPRLFQDINGSYVDEFLQRGFELEEVVSIEIDRSIGSAFVHLHPKSSPPPIVLARLGDKLAAKRRKNWVSVQYPYFDWQESSGRSIYARAPKTVSGLRRRLYAGLGMLSFGLGGVGVVLPLMPTAPFIILSSYFALKASPSLNQRLLQSRLFGRMIKDWYMHRAMRRSTMHRVVTFMVIVFGLTFGLARPSGAALPTMLVISGLSFWFVLRMPSVEDEKVLPTSLLPVPPLLAITQQ